MHSLIFSHPCARVAIVNSKPTVCSMHGHAQHDASLQEADTASSALQTPRSLSIQQKAVHLTLLHTQLSVLCCADEDSCMSRYTVLQGRTKEVEPWYSTDFSQEPVPNEWLSSWLKAVPNSAIHLPKPNPFISSAFGLIDVRLSPTNPQKYCSFKCPYIPFLLDLSYHHSRHSGSPAGSRHSLTENMDALKCLTCGLRCCAMALAHQQDQRFVTRQSCHDLSSTKQQDMKRQHCVGEGW